MKITLAKTKNLALLLFFLLAINNANYSQCIGTSIYPAGTVTVSPTVQTIVDNNYPLGNYAVCNFGALGQYRVDASIGQFVTLTDNSNVVIASGPTPFVFNIPSAGLYRIHIFNDGFCSTFATPPIIAINPTNRAFYFDGINDYINIGNTINTKS